MQGDSDGRRGARAAALLVMAGLLTGDGAFGRSVARPSSSGASRAAESLEAERHRADPPPELASVRAQFDHTLSRVNDVFWTVEILGGR